MSHQFSLVDEGKEERKGKIDLKKYEKKERNTKKENIKSCYSVSKYPYKRS